MLIPIPAKGLGAPLTKLIETASAAIGTLYEPTRIRREARAHADAAIVMANADTELREIAERAGHRIAFQEIRRQHNIEGILGEAQKYLPGEVSPEAVDPDWASRFFESAQDVSDQHLRSAWAKLLANEVAQPGQFSRRTLSVLRDLHPEDAKLFQRFQRLVWVGADGAHFAIAPGGWDVAVPVTEMPFDLVVQLMDAGLVAIPDSIYLPEPPPPRLRYGGTTVYFKNAQQILVALLSTAGKELSAIVEAERSEAYFRATLEFLRTSHAMEAVEESAADSGTA